MPKQAEAGRVGARIGKQGLGSGRRSGDGVRQGALSTGQPWLKGSPHLPLPLCYLGSR